MITLEILFNRLDDFYLNEDEGIKIPYTEGVFDRKIEPPHIAFTDIDYDFYNADDSNYFSKVNERLELTTLARDRKLEKRIEKEILKDIIYEKEVAYIESEGIWNISYFFYLEEGENEE